MFSQCVAVPARSGRLIMQLLSLEKIVIVIIGIIIIVNVIIVKIVLIFIVIIDIIFIISYPVDILMTHIMYYQLPRFLSFFPLGIYQLQILHDLYVYTTQWSN